MDTFPPDLGLWVTHLLGVASLAAPVGALWLIVTRMRPSPRLRVKA